MSRYYWLGAVLCGMAVAVCLLGGFWWWAIAGLSREVATALYVTGSVALLGFIVCWLVAAEADR